MPARKPPPPSPLRKGGTRPPPPPGTGGGPAPAPVAAAGSAGGVTAGKIVLGAGIGLAIAVGIGGGGWLVMTALQPDALPVVAQVPQPAPLAQPDSPLPPGEQNPELESAPQPVDPAPPPETAPAPNPSAPDPSSTTPSTPGPAAVPGPTAPSPPAPVTTTPAQPAPSTSGPALDELRQQGRYLALPEPKEVKEALLGKVHVAAPTDCDLALVGLDELLPAGTACKLERRDPAADVREWSLNIKLPGALSKEKTVADFRLRAETLSFQWRPAIGAPPPLALCLLQIDAGGDRLLCQLSQPLEWPPATPKVIDRWILETQLPSVLAGQSATLQLEILPRDFPTVVFDGGQILKSGESTKMKVAAATSGAAPVEIEWEVKFKLDGGKATVALEPYAVQVNPAAPAKLAERGPLSVNQLKRRRTDLGRQLKEKDQGIKKLQSELAGLKREEQILTAAAGQNANALRQLGVVQQRITQGEELVADAKAERDEIGEIDQWHADMQDLISGLESKATLTFRLFRPVGQEVVEIAAPPAQP